MKFVKYLFVLLLLITHNLEAQNIAPAPDNRPSLQSIDDSNLFACNWFWLSYPELEELDKVLLVSTKQCYEEHNAKKSVMAYQQFVDNLKETGAYLHSPEEGVISGLLDTVGEAVKEEVISRLVGAFSSLVGLFDTTHDLITDMNRNNHNLEFIESEFSRMVYAIAPKTLFSSKQISGQEELFLPEATYIVASELMHNETLKIPGLTNSHSPNEMRSYDCQYNANSSSTALKSVFCKTTINNMEDLLTVISSIGSPVIKDSSWDWDPLPNTQLDDIASHWLHTELVPQSVAGVVSHITINEPYPDWETNVESLLTHITDSTMDSLLLGTPSDEESNDNLLPNPANPEEVQPYMEGNNVSLSNEEPGSNLLLTDGEGSFNLTFNLTLYVHFTPLIGLDVPITAPEN